ncbi:MAG: hypothetical protein IT384_15100 [Deltaproteobacteria bacterium]|nr:hypothetical protein [Deltaproteobacteria bacterium]
MSPGGRLAGRRRGGVALSLTFRFTSTFAFAFAVTLALSGCGGTSPAGSPGPHPVGVTTLELESEGRTLPVDVWYPAEEGGIGERYRLFLADVQLAEMISPLSAVRDAAPNRSDGPYPIVVFSHGNGGVRFQSVYLTEHLASHGFVVAAPDHVGNTFADLIDERRALSPFKAAVVRPTDVSRTLDALLDPAAAGIVSALGDQEHVGVAGHSFGAYTAIRIAGASIDVEALKRDCAAKGGMVCEGLEGADAPASQRDPRFSAAIAQAPAGSQAFFAIGRNGYQDVATPLMLQAGSLDQLADPTIEAFPVVDALPAPSFLVEIGGAGHFTFSDLCFVVRQLGLTIEEFQDGCSDANLPYDRAQPPIQRYATAFFLRYLKDESAPDEALDPKEPLQREVSAFLAK